MALTRGWALIILFGYRVVACLKWALTCIRTDTVVSEVLLRVYG